MNQGFSKMDALALDFLSKDKNYVDLDKPFYDLSTYMGRAIHFIRLTNPVNAFASDAELEKAKKVVAEVRKSKRIPEGYNEDKLWAAKYLYDSAFHPDTGEKMMVAGRMSAQAPMNTLITGCMITFYKTTSATVFWQWINQTFYALVNYTNRSGDAPLSPKQLAASYCAACGGALGTALYLNSLTKNMSPMWGRMVPFAAVMAANFINIPMMRSNEILGGTPVFTADGHRVGNSKKAACYGIFLVCVSRVLMAMPGMTLTPILTDVAEKKGLFKKYPRAILPFQLGLVGIFVTVATPLCCALFEQQVSLSVDSIEPELKEIMDKKFSKYDKVYFNKGL